MSLRRLALGSLFVLAVQANFAVAQSGILCRRRASEWSSGLAFDSGYHDQRFVEIAAGGDFTLARREDGSVVGWGSNSYGECEAPALPPGLTYTQIAAAGFRGTWGLSPYVRDHSVVLRSDGAVFAWGYNENGKCEVPALPPGLTYVEVAAGRRHSLARRSDGSVVAWCSNANLQCDVPVLPRGLTYTRICAGAIHSVAIRSDGSVDAWGNNYYGQCVVPPLPQGSTYVEIAAGRYFTLARRSDGSVVAWGENYYGECNVPALPPGLTYVEIAAVPRRRTPQRRLHRGVGDNTASATSRSLLQARVPQITAGWGHTVARRSDGSVIPGATTPPGAAPTSGRTDLPRSRRAAPAIGLRSDRSIVAGAQLGRPVRCADAAARVTYGGRGHRPFPRVGATARSPGAAVPVRCPRCRRIRYVEISAGARSPHE